MPYLTAMRTSLAAIVAVALFTALPRITPASERPRLDNPAIDAAAFLKVATRALEHRAERRLSEQEFLAMSKRPGAIILDARSKALFDRLHIKGAVNLSFPDISVDRLAQVLPDKNALILIYCNNNFENERAAFPTKLPSASLNLSTYVALYDYGYRNVYELGPLLDVRTTKIPFEGRGSRASK